MIWEVEENIERTMSLSRLQRSLDSEEYKADKGPKFLWG